MALWALELQMLFLTLAGFSCHFLLNYHRNYLQLCQQQQHTAIKTWNHFGFGFFFNPPTTTHFRLSKFRKKKKKIWQRCPSIRQATLWLAVVSSSYQRHLSTFQSEMRSDGFNGSLWSLWFGKIICYDSTAVNNRQQCHASRTDSSVNFQGNVTLEADIWYESFFFN